MLDCKIKLHDFTQQNKLLLNCNFQWSGKGILGLNGPTGSGKSTLLHTLAGFQQPKFTDGQIIWNQTLLQRKLPPVFLAADKRAISLVFQDQLLFPHINVQQNLQFARKHGYKPLNNDDFQNLIHGFHLQGLLHKLPQQLSGGEKNRVTLAQSLCALPDLLLLDEPFSALDGVAKYDTISALKNIIRSFDIAVILVSHSFHELAYLCDEILLIDNNATNGPYSDVINQLNLCRIEDNSLEPVSTFLRAQLLEYDESEGQATFNLDGEEVLISCRHTPASVENIEIPAHEVSILLAPPVGSSIANCLPVTLKSYITLQDAILLTLSIKQQFLYCKITKKSFNQLNLHKEMSIFAQFKATAIHTF